MNIPAFGYTGIYIVFPMSNDNRLELRLDSTVSKSDFERIKKLIDMAENSLVHADDGDEGKPHEL